MSSTNVSERTLEWALTTFRPLLQDLRLQNIASDRRFVFTSGYKVFQRHNMSNCVVFIKTRKFENVSMRGYFVWQYDAETNMYALHIFINENLFVNEDLELRIRRKATGVHEFTHCVASMMIFSLLESKALKATLHDRMNKRFHYLDNESLEHLIYEYTLPYEEREKLSEKIFDDEHFRIVGDAFTGYYDELFEQFLLSYQLFTEDKFFTADRRKSFKKLLKTGEKERAVKLLVETIEKLSQEKALDVRFITQRISRDFLKKIINE